MTVKNETTLKNLMDAFAGESQANRKYLAFAKKAEADGYPNIAKLFRSAADAETIHAIKHFETAGKVGSTLENLQAAVEGETFEFEKMYPDFIKQAQQAEEQEAVRTFAFADKAEQVHAKLYSEALEALKAGKDIEATYFVCPVCGNIEKGKVDKCSICGVSGEKFFQV